MEFIIYAVMVFIYAAIVGSFLNVCIYRIPNNVSIVAPPSACPACGRRLGFKDMVPILSYFFIGGRCRHCKSKISIRYPVVEALTAILVTFIFLRYGLTLQFFSFAILTCILITISFTDIDCMIIPDKIMLPSFILAAILLLTNLDAVQGKLIGMLVGGGVFLLIFFATSGKMGGGDIKLMFVLGLWLGWQSILLTMFLSFIYGAVLGLALIGLKIFERGKPMPFGPFISMGAYTAILFGEDIIGWYTGILLG